MLASARSSARSRHRMPGAISLVQVLVQVGGVARQDHRRPSASSHDQRAVARRVSRAVDEPQAGAQRALVAIEAPAVIAREVGGEVRAVAVLLRGRPTRRRGSGSRRPEVGEAARVIEVQVPSTIASTSRGPMPSRASSRGSRSSSVISGGPNGNPPGP